MERGVGPCLGECPVYSLTVHGDGLVEYEGERNVGTEGRRWTYISEEQVRQLVGAFLEIGFFTLDDWCGAEIKKLDDGTDRYVCMEKEDVPFTYTSITIGEMHKRIRNQGRWELHRLDALIDELTESWRWVVGPTSTPSP